MTLEQVKIELRRLKISLKQAAKEIGYSRSHFYKVMNYRHPITRTFLNDLNTYLKLKLSDRKEVPKEDLMDDIYDINEMSLPHNFEWKKLKQTELYKNLTNGRKERVL